MEGKNYKIKIVKRNPDRYEHIYVFGDIHGMVKRLDSLLARVPYTKQDLLVFLGDYIDRGEDSVGVIDRIMALEKKTHVVALKGNHEAWAVSYLDMLYKGDMQYVSDNSLWLEYGGYATLRSLEQSGDPLKYAQWMHNRPHILLLGDEFRCSHSGIDPDKSLQEQTESDVLWSRDSFLRGYEGKEQWYIGHTTVQSLTKKNPICSPARLPNNIYLLDTGSFLPNGRISCREVKSGKVYQSDL